MEIYGWIPTETLGITDKITSKIADITGEKYTSGDYCIRLKNHVFVWISLFNRTLEKSYYYTGTLELLKQQVLIQTLFCSLRLSWSPGSRWHDLPFCGCCFPSVRSPYLSVFCVVWVCVFSPLCYIRTLALPTSSHSHLVGENSQTLVNISVGTEEIMYPKTDYCTRSWDSSLRRKSHLCCNCFVHC